MPMAIRALLVGRRGVLIGLVVKSVAVRMSRLQEMACGGVIVGAACR
jgi:hypothetical protein